MLSIRRLCSRTYVSNAFLRFVVILVLLALYVLKCVVCLASDVSDTRKMLVAALVFTHTIGP